MNKEKSALERSRSVWSRDGPGCGCGHVCSPGRAVLGFVLNRIKSSMKKRQELL